MHLETFKNVNEAAGYGRVIIRCVDGPSIILEPEQEAHVWVLGGRFYRNKPGLWQRALVSMGWRA